MKYIINKTLFRITFFISLIILLCVLGTNGIKSPTDLKNYVPYMCCTMENYKQTLTFEAKPTCEVILKGETLNIPVGECLGDEPNAFYTTSSLLLVCLFSLALTFNHYKFNKKVKE